MAVGFAKAAKIVALRQTNPGKKMKKAILLAAVSAMVALASCHSGTSSETSSDAGQSIDSMVNQATSAVGNAADSVAQGAQQLADSTGAKIDSTAAKIDAAAGGK